MHICTVHTYALIAPYVLCVLCALCVLGTYVLYVLYVLYVKCVLCELRFAYTYILLNDFEEISGER